MEYLAVINIMTGGVFGRNADPDKAVERAVREARGFARSLGGFKRDARVTVRVYAVKGDATIEDGAVYEDGVQLRVSRLYDVNPNEGRASWRLVPIPERST